MTSGMLWFDNDPGRTLAQKVERAAEHYRRKYGQPANVVFVHPATDAPEVVGGVRVARSRMVMPDHLWLGVAE